MFYFDSFVRAGVFLRIRHRCVFFLLGYTFQMAAFEIVAAMERLLTIVYFRENVFLVCLFRSEKKYGYYFYLPICLTYVESEEKKYL